ncbi:response regulator receiver protein [Sesbania bispinosa]|nr:response regulator receiver protein [Sesbania bispinosa]
MDTNDDAASIPLIVGRSSCSLQEDKRTVRGKRRQRQWCAQWLWFDEEDHRCLDAGGGVRTPVTWRLAVVGRRWCCHCGWMEDG